MRDQIPNIEKSWAKAKRKSHDALGIPLWGKMRFSQPQIANITVIILLTGSFGIRGGVLLTA